MREKIRHLKLCIGVSLIILCSGVALPSTQKYALARQNPLVTLGFNRCNSSPCFWGIIPRKTNWQDATSILLKQNFNKNNWVLSNIDSSGDGISIDRVPDNPDFVNSVELSNLRKTYNILLSDVLELYGFPCGVRSDFNGSFWFAYPNMLVNALSDSQRDPTKASVIYLVLVDPQLHVSTSGINVCEKTEYSPEYLLWFTVVI